MKKLIIMVSPSGGGKSTYIKNYFPTAKVCSADYYMFEDNEYKFDYRKLSNAHKQCQQDAEHFMSNNEELVAIDNTNLQSKYRMYYLELAEKYNYNVEIHVLPFNNNAFHRNIRGVSMDILMHQIKSCDLVLGNIYNKNYEIIGTISETLTGID